MLVLGGCMPSNYTKEGKKDLTNTYIDETKVWFADNLPDATFKKGEAYASANDLFLAMEGTYFRGGTEYRYLYDCENKDMYLEEPYIACKEKLKSILAKEWNVSEEQIDIYLNSARFFAKTANDNAKNTGHEIEGSFLGVDVLLFDTDIDRYAADSLAGEREHDLNVTVHDADANLAGAIAKEYLTQHPGIDYITYEFSVAEYESAITSLMCNKESIVIRYQILKKVEDNLYAGYTKKIVGEYPFDESAISGILSETDLFEAAWNADGQLEFTIPESSEALLYGNYKAMTQNFQNSNKEWIKRELSKNKKGQLYEFADKTGVVKNEPVKYMISVEK